MYEENLTTVKLKPIFFIENTPRRFYTQKFYDIVRADKFYLAFKCTIYCITLTL